MTASEFAFLALGLVLGVASGAALSMVIRARPPAPREVRVTIEPAAVPRRPPATLSGLVAPGAEAVPAARGGPADPSILVAADHADPSRTPVRIGSTARGPVPIPIRPEADPELEALRRAEDTAPPARQRLAR
jgi:hypothetical protein